MVYRVTNFKKIIGDKVERLVPSFALITENGLCVAEQFHRPATEDKKDYTSIIPIVLKFTDDTINKVKNLKADEGMSLASVFCYTNKAGKESDITYSFRISK